MSKWPIALAVAGIWASTAAAAVFGNAGNEAFFFAFLATLCVGIFSD